MTNSTLYSSLIVKTEYLMSRYLSFTLDFGEIPNQEQRYDIKSAIIFVHAEIENFIEDRCRELAREAIIAWDSGVVSMQIISFLAAYHSGWDDIKDYKGQVEKLIQRSRKRKNDSSSYKEANGYVQIAKNDYYKIIEDNNGIKEADLKSLLAPIGLTMAEFDAEWIKEINEFGKQRGTIAHLKDDGKAIDLADVKTRINRVMNGLNDFDKAINRHILNISAAKPNIKKPFLQIFIDSLTKFWKRDK